jgi:hypothetical protein
VFSYLISVSSLLLYDHGYIPLIISTSQFFPNSCINTGFVTRVSQRMPLMKQELLTLPEHPSSPSVFSVVRCALCCILRCFTDRCLCFCPFSSGHCVVCPSIFGFWLPLWYYQTILPSPDCNLWQLHVCLYTVKQLCTIKNHFKRNIQWTTVYNLTQLLNINAI